MKSNQASVRPTHRLGPTATSLAIAARAGAIPSLLLAAIASIFALGILGYLAVKIRPDAKTQKSDEKVVRVYCAAGVAKPTEQIAEAFNRLSDYEVQIARIGGSGELAGQIKTEFETQILSPAQLFITNDQELLNQASMIEVYKSRHTVASQQPAIAVSAEANQSFSGIGEMLEAKMRFGIASKRTAIGLLGRKIAGQQNMLSQLEQNKTLDAENVMVLAQALVTGSIDAAIIWDTTVQQINAQSEKPVLKIAGPADPTGQTNGYVAVGIVATSSESPGARAFTDFLINEESAKLVLKRFGFQSAIQND